MSWYGKVLIDVDDDDMIASFASESTFSFPGKPVCEGTNINSLIFIILND